MELSKYRKNLGVAAAALGVIQAITWTFLTLLAIIVHYWEPEIDPSSSYTRVIEIWLYYKFLVDDGTFSSMTFILTPSRFVILMWLYFVICVIWGTLSADMFSAIHSNKNRQLIVMRLWGIDTLIVSMLDLVFVILLGTDYAACGSGNSNGVTDAQYLCYTSVGIAMAIAARGFTLWVINIVFAIVMLKESSGSRATKGEDESNQSIYSTIPRARLVNRLFPYRQQNS